MKQPAHATTKYTPPDLNVDIIRDSSALGSSGQCKRGAGARIVELAVEVDQAGFQVVLLQHGKLLECLGLSQQVRAFFTLKARDKII